MRVGITGHQDLARYDAIDWVALQLGTIIRSLRAPVVGFTSLAAGSDQLFAREVLRHAGEIHAVIPFPGYESRFSEGPDRRAYRELLDAAAHRLTIERRASDEASYLAAGKYIVDNAELLVAVWDGLPAQGLGGTGDVVAYALQQGRPVEQVNPRTRRVSSRRWE